MGQARPEEREMKMKPHKVAKIKDPIAKSTHKLKRVNTTVNSTTKRATAGPIKKLNRSQPKGQKKK